ncbi:MAG: hypothetical protein RLZ18_94, partial [Actinomycetota bacterium]
MAQLLSKSAVTFSQRLCATVITANVKVAVHFRSISLRMFHNLQSMVNYAPMKSAAKTTTMSMCIAASA